MPVSPLNPEKQHFHDSISMAMDLAENVAIQLRAVGEHLKADDLPAAVAHDAATKASHIRGLLRETQTEVLALEAMTDMSQDHPVRTALAWQFAAVLQHTDLVRLRQISAIDHQNVARFDIDTTGLSFVFPGDQKAAAIDYADQGGSRIKPLVVETAPDVDPRVRFQEPELQPATPSQLDTAPLVEQEAPPPPPEPTTRPLASQETA